jgi:hypothetical protein
MGNRRNVYKILVGKPEGKQLFGRQRHGLRDNIKTDLKEIGNQGVEWIQLAQDRHP